MTSPAVAAKDLFIMARIVQKFGGTSVGTVERIRKVADWALKTRAEGHEVILVVSAMSGETNRLVALAKEVNPNPYSAEYDMMLASGEQVSCALTALAINTISPGTAQAFLGNQIGIRTDSFFSKARIRSIDSDVLRASLDKKQIPVIAGFQGMDEENRITTLGRGGSDTTAVAIAIASQADRCEIYTDVDGVYTTDPRLCKEARRIDSITYDEMLEMAHLGAKVLQIRSVELAAKYQMPIQVLSSFNLDSQSSYQFREGTRVENKSKTNLQKTAHTPDMEEALVTAITSDVNQVKITLKQVPHRPDSLAQVFKKLAKAGVVVDVIIQEAFTNGTQALSFTIAKEDLLTVQNKLGELKAELFSEMTLENTLDLAKVSIIGVGMQNHPGVAAKMFEILAQGDIPIELVSTSEIKVSCLIAKDHNQKAVQALHRGFELGASTN
jgi:aspartate kinase